MNIPADKTQPDKSQRVVDKDDQKQRGEEPAFQFFDDRPEARLQRKLQEMANINPRSNQAVQFQEMAANYADQLQQPIQTKKNNTGLPDHLKSGIENLSGLSMDDVRVHRNSEKPAQLQAYAFAQGSTIHLAPGQEKHLPHEAWHVVQQKQGRVQPTLQLKGRIEVNDDAGLEKEADVMGALALSEGRQGLEMENKPISPPKEAPLQAKVIQLLSSQIVMNEGARTIKHIVVRGRPPRAHGSRMGDHTTAFIVHIEGLNIKLENKSVPEAIGELNALQNHIRNLPGMSVSEIQDVQEELDELKRQIESAEQAIKSDEGEDMAIHHLQLAVNAYLRARELVPFSTINVAAVSVGLAGKGHGESRHAAVLSQAERGLDESIQDEQLVEAVYGLFDDQAAGMTAVETEPTTVSSLMGRNIHKIDDGAMNRLTPIWQQHLESIAAMFPTCYSKIRNKLSIEPLESRLKALDLKNLKWGVNFAKIEIGKIGRTLQDLKLEFSGKKKLPQAKNKFVLTKISKLAGIYRALGIVDQSLLRLDRTNQRMGNTFDKDLNEIRSLSRSLRKEINQELPTYDAKSEQDTMIETSSHLSSNFRKKGSPDQKNKLRDLHEISLGPPSSPGFPINYPSSPVYSGFGSQTEPAEMEKGMDVSSDYEEEQSDSGADNRMDVSGDSQQEEEEFEISSSEGTLVHETHSMAIQLILNSEHSGVRIVGMLSSGRPPSPFKGTMGAHSTAWIVHLDRVRRRLMGKTLPDAVIEMQALISETQRLAKSLEGKEMGDNALGLIGDAQENIENAGKISPDKASIDQVQQMITHTLSYLNLLPGISQQAVNTNGNAEGDWRSVLLKFEYENIGTQKEIEKAINKLYDSKGAGARSKHQKFIAEAYPRAARFAQTGKIPEMNGELGSQKPASNDVGNSGSRQISSGQLSSTDISSMREFYNLDNYLNIRNIAGINNCLFNAIADAANVARPSIETVIEIREMLQVPLGEMLTATQRNLDLILEKMGLADRGAIVFYIGEEWTDTTTHIGEDVLFIQHDGFNHFTAARQFMVTPDLKLPEQELKDHSEDSGDVEMKEENTPMSKVFTDPPRSMLRIGATLMYEGLYWKVISFKKVEDSGDYEVQFEPIGKGLYF